MKADQDRLKVLLIDTIALLCKSGLTFKRELRVQGLLGITVDDEDVFIVQLDEKVFTDGLGSCRPFDDGSDNGVGSLPTSAPPHPVLLSRVIPSSPPIGPNRINRGRERPLLTHRTLQAKRQRMMHENDSFSSPGFESTGGCVVPLGSDLNLNNTNSQSPSELGTVPLHESSGQFGSVSNALMIRPVGSDSFQPEYTSLPFDSSFIHPEFSPTRFVGSSSDMAVPSGEVRQKIKRKIKNTSNLNQSGFSDLTGSQHDQIRYEVNSQWSSNVVPASDDQPNGSEMWSSGPREVKLEKPDDSFHENFNDSWSSANGNSANGNNVNDSSSGTSTKNQRRRHHDSDDKSFACQYEGCDKAFYRKDHLVRHQRQKHGKPYGVDSQIVFYCHDTECNKMFYKVSTLRRHMVEAHNYAAEPDYLQPSQSMEPGYPQSSLLPPTEFVIDSAHLTS